MKYSFQNLLDKLPSYCFDDTIEFEVISLDIFESVDLIDYLESFTEHHSKVGLPKIVEQKLSDLLDIYDLLNLKIHFITLISALQKTYSCTDDFDSETSEIESFFLSAPKDWEKVFDSLELFLFPDTDISSLKSISFKNKSPKKSITVDNTFIINDLYSAICIGLNITRDNFIERKQELVSRKIFNYNKQDSFLRALIIQELYNFLSSSIKGKNEKLRFITLIIKLAQIDPNPNSSTNSHPINYSNTIEDILKDCVEYRILANFLETNRGYKKHLS